MNGILCAELRSVRSLVSHCLALHGVHAAHSASSELCNQQQQSIADSQLRDTIRPLLPGHVLFWEAVRPIRGGFVKILKSPGFWGSDVECIYNAHSWFI